MRRYPAARPARMMPTRLLLITGVGPPAWPTSRVSRPADVGRVGIGASVIGVNQSSTSCDLVAHGATGPSVILPPGRRAVNLAAGTTGILNWSTICYNYG